MNYRLMADIAMLAWQLIVMYWIIRLQISEKRLSNSMGHMVGAVTKMAGWTGKANELLQSLVKNAGTDPEAVKTSGVAAVPGPEPLLRLPTTVGHVWVSLHGITTIQDVPELPGDNGVPISGALVVAVGVGHLVTLSAEEVRKRLDVALRAEDA